MSLRKLAFSDMSQVFFILMFGLAFTSVARADRPISADERRERIEAVIIGKFADELSLTPSDAEKFYPRLTQFRNETHAMQNDLNDTRRRLDELAKNGNADPASKEELKYLLTRSNDLQTAILDKREALLTDLADFLSPQQVSRCAVLLDDIPRRIRQSIHERGEPVRNKSRDHERRPRRNAR